MVTQVSRSIDLRYQARRVADSDALPYSYAFVSLFYYPCTKVW